MRKLLIAIAVVVPLVAGAQLESSQTSDPVLEKCVVKFIDDVELPASEAGVLLFLGVKEGAVVAKGDEIARIDDREAQIQKEISNNKYAAAYARANDEVDKEYAVAAAAVAKADYEEKRAARNSHVGAVVTESEVRRSGLDAHRSELAVEKAIKDQQLAKYDALVAQSELSAAEMAIEKRTIKAPFGGTVRRVIRQEAEWVNPGDPILEIVRYDVLKVEGYIDLSEYDPAEVAGREVTISFAVGRGRVEQATGRIVLVEQQVKLSGDRSRYMVRAEIPNRQVGGRWVIMPSLSATMQIHLDRPAVNVSRRRTAQ